MIFRHHAAIWLLLVLAFAPAATATAKPHAAEAKRATLVPGFSLAFPASWFGCGDLAKRLPHPTEADHALAEMCRPVANAKAHAIFLTATEAVDLTVIISDLPMSENAVRSMESHFLERLRKNVCEKITSEFASHGSVGNCTLRPKRAGGHQWIVVSYVVTPAHGQRKWNIREIMTQYGDKTVEVQFGFIAIATGKGDDMVDAMLDSVEIDASRAPSVPPAELVQIAPAQNVALGVPRGWRSCRDDVDAALGNAPAHRSLSATKFVRP